MGQGNSKVLRGLNGRVLEVGAGDGKKKLELTKKYKDIKEYIATDFSSWDDIFDKHTKKAKKYKGLREIIFGYQQRIKMDKVCSATELPFEDNSFDYHLSFEVLEHINEPEKYFSEAARVLKSGGRAVFSVPFFYRIHGREPEHREDFYRYANGFYYYVAEKYGFTVEKILSNTGFGTSATSMANQWLIRRIMESNILIRLICLLVSPLFFLINNLLGIIIDVSPDPRFPNRFHVVLKKK